MHLYNDDKLMIILELMYAEIEDDIVGELLDVVCWFSPYEKESHLKRVQVTI